ncbi:MAG: MGMT family protein [Gammaproteobacteria bacterium]|nr:MGMT family protein [Gammaproteobacteria bacterium]
MSGHDQQIYDMVCRIPEGYVATYGQIARLVDKPNGARQVGYALARLYDTDDVPWHRVVNARGEISARAKPGCEDYQRSLLEDEGVTFNLDGRIDLTRYLWARN